VTNHSLLYITEEDSFETVITDSSSVPDINVTAVTTPATDSSFLEARGEYTILVVNVSDNETRRNVWETLSQNHPSTPKILLAETTKTVICEEWGGDDTTHIDKNRADLTEHLSLYIEAAISEQEQSNNCLEPNAKYVELLKEIHDNAVGVDGSSDLNNQIKSYAEILHENTLADRYAITRATTPQDDDREKVAVATAGVEPNTNELVDIPERVLEATSSAEGKDEVITLGVKDQEDCSFDLTSNHEVYIVTPVMTDGEKFGHLHLFKEDWSFNGFSDVITEIINITSNIIAQEINATKKDNEIVRRVEKLQKFRYIISHDIITPLSTAKGRVEIAKEKHNSIHLEEAFSAIERMQKMIESTERLLDAGGDITVDEKHDMKAVAEESWKIIDAQSADLVVENNFELYADEQQFKTILENLFKNSIEHGNNDVTIRVRKQTPITTTTRTNPSEKFSFVVEDDGGGIPEDVEGSLFEKRKTTKQKESISGFGLTIVKSAVESHGWDIEVDHTYTDGARFVISGVV